MFSLLRRINFPEHIQTSSCWIKAELINHVRHYEDLHSIAHREIVQMKAQAMVEVNALKENAREEIAASLASELQKIQSLSRSKEAWLENQLVEFCDAMCVEVINHFISGLSDAEKIHVLLESVIKQQFSKRNLVLRVNPEHLDLVETLLARVLAEQMNITKWSVQADADLPMFELHVSVSNGSEVQISLQNILALYRDEIGSCARQSLSNINLAEYQ